jgi:hypothetical protein
MSVRTDAVILRDGWADDLRHGLIRDYNGPGDCGQSARKHINESLNNVRNVLPINLKQVVRNESLGP